MNFCIKCGNQLKPDARFCNKCGEPTDQNQQLNQPMASIPVCSSCGAELSAGIKFCTNCGIAVHSSPPLSSPTRPQPIMRPELHQKTDKEYPTEIMYTGEVTLTIKDKNFKEKSKTTVTAKNGTIEETGFNLSKDEKLIASIAFGGIVVESPEFMGVSENVFGLYQGTYSMTLNEENIMFMYTDIITKDISPEMQKLDLEVGQHSARIFIAGVNWIKGVAQGGPIAKFEIGRNGINSTAYETNGLKYYVYNLSNTSFIPKFLTPLKDKSNSGTVLQGLTNGFCIHTKQGTADITINATFQVMIWWAIGKQLTKGKILWSTTFTARKIVGM